MAHITDKLYNRRWGIFTHFLHFPNNEGEVASWHRRTDAVDTDYIARTLHEIGAGYYFFTLMQGRKYMNAPNAAYDKITNNKPGEACATRDLPLDLYNSLQKYGIDLYLYYTGDGPYISEREGRAFGFIEPREVGVTLDFVTKWASVLREYAVRYGDKVKGWWLDGCYKGQLKYTEELIRLYYDAIKAGNPEAIAAFNDAVKPGVTKDFECSDYTCGEFNDFTAVPPSRFIDGAQAHILAPLGVPYDGDEWHAWCSSGLKHDARYMSDYINRVNANGGVVTIDIRLTPDGRFDDEQIEMLRNIRID